MYDGTFFSENFPPWEQLTDAQKQDIITSSELRSYKKGTNIHSGEEECLGLVFIKKGSLRVYMLSDEGREITLYRLFEGDICILTASCVISSITFDVHVDTEEDTDIVLMSALCFRRLTATNVHVECFSYKLATERFSEVMWAMQQILFMSMDKRLAVFLLDELAKSPDDTVRMTHEQAAKYMGSAREVVSRMLKYFASENLVALSRGGIKIIDKAGLRKLAQ